MANTTLYQLSKDLHLIDLAPPIEGFEEFIGCYVLIRESVALIDVGPSSSIFNLLHGLSSLGLMPERVNYLFITHIHIDHAGALGDLLPYMPNAKVIVHEKGKRHLVDPGKLWEGSRKTLGVLAERYGPIAPVSDDRIIVASEGMTFDLGKNTAIEVLETPGHASHHLSFFDKGDKRLFVGEAAGVRVKDILRPATPPPFNLKVKLDSLDKLIKQKPSTLCYGHLGSSEQAVQLLSLHRRQLLLWDQIISSRIGEHADIDEIESRLRDKDEFYGSWINYPIASAQESAFSFATAFADSSPI